MKDIKSHMVMRELTEADLEQYNDLLRYAFQVTDEELHKVGWDEDEIKNSKSPVLKAAEVLGWFEGDHLASEISVYPMQVNIQGRVYPVGYVTGVATYPEYSGMGLMSALIRRCLMDMRKRGQSISLLYPYSIPLYRHKGWEIVSDKMT
ncbi:MAG: enhanced intracellular survival protein Eis, partial [Christensenellaceae bacterium]